MHQQNVEFIQWASAYETGDLPGRSLPLERNFISRYCAALLEVQVEQPIDALVETIAKFVESDLY